MKFKTLKKHSPYVIIILISFLIMCGSAITAGLFFFVNERSVEYLIPVAGGAFFLIPTYWIYLQSYAWYTAYFLESDHLYLKGVYKKESFPYQTISGIQIISEVEVAKILEEPMIIANEKGRNSDLKGWYRENKRYSEIIKFCTVQFAHGAAGNTSHRTERYAGVHGVTELVKLSINDGRIFLLSPEAPEAFVMELKSKII